MKMPLLMCKAAMLIPFYLRKKAHLGIGTLVLELSFVPFSSGLLSSEPELVEALSLSCDYRAQPSLAYLL
jgi:hypothetical protein